MGVTGAALAKMGQVLKHGIKADNYSRSGLILQGIVVMVAVVAYQLYPRAPVGVWIAGLGAVAVIVAVRTEHWSKGEKIVWVIIAFAIMFTEIRGIYQDRDDHDEAQRVYDQQQHLQREEEGKHFAEIAKRLQASIEQSEAQFQATVRENRSILSATKEGINTMTGGDSICYFEFFVPPNNTSFKWTLFVREKGRYHLHNVRAQMYDRMHREITPGLKGKYFDFAALSGTEMEEMDIAPDEEQWFDIYFDSGGRHWWQVIAMKTYVVPSGYYKGTKWWAQATQLVSMGEKDGNRILFRQIDENIFGKNFLHEMAGGKNSTMPPKFH